MSIRVREFEEYCYPNIRKQFPAKDGWNIEHGKTVGTVCGRISWVVYRGNERVIVFCKVKKKLTMNDIDNIVSCKGEYKATQAIVYTAKYTEVESSLRKYAEERNIYIRKTEWAG
ncbi:MAG: hypothetical protein ABGF52_13590 [Candidatus Asgardarchaeum sp.]